MNTQTPLSYEWFRSRDFRLDSGHVDHNPHMVLMLDHYERALEVSLGSLHPNEFLVWLRSDISQSKCRFVFARRAMWSSQIESLYAGLTDKVLMEVNWDAAMFADSLERERNECLRRAKEYQAGHRFGRVPG